MSAALEYQPQCASETFRPVYRLFAWLVAASGAWLVVAMIIGAPVLLASGHYVASGAIYAGFSRVCHQLSERSFFIAGHPLAVCARCTGLYVGFAAGVSCYPLVRSLRRMETPPRIWLMLAAAPTVIDFSLGYLGIWANTHSSRFATGALLGAVAAFYVVPGFVGLSWAVASRLRSGRVNRPVNARVEVTTSDPSCVISAPSDYGSPTRRI